MSETGPDRIRKAIERDRGGNAPRHRVQVCGPGCRGEIYDHDPDANEVIPPPPKMYRGFVADRLVCPGCIRLRFSPIHLFNRLVGICDGRGW